MKVSSAQSGALTRELQKVQIEDNFRLQGKAEQLARSSEDQIKVSPAARQLQNLQATLRSEAAGLPDVREDRLAAVRERMASGFYNTSEFTDKLADKMGADPDLQQTLGMNRTSVPGTEYRDSLMQDVRGKIQDEFYTDNQVMDFVADRLLNIYAGAGDDA